VKPRNFLLGRGRPPGPGGLVLGLALTPALPWLALVPFGRYLLPLLAPLVVYPFFAHFVRERRYGAAWALGMAWALLLSVGVVTQVHLDPDTAATLLNGEPYRQEMFHWIETGEGSEGEPARFLPIHLSHLAAFAVLCWLSGGYLGLVLGALLTAYMSYFVGGYAVAAGAPVAGFFLAWVPWSVVRVAAFVLLGSVLARPLLVRRLWPMEVLERRLLALGLAGIVTDVVVKALAADGYGLLLRRFADGAVLG
jgi:hypothetical protein